MKVILLEDVKKVGEEGQVVEVKSGYALNYLIPNKLAKLASDSNVKAQKHFDKAQAAKNEENRQRALSLKEELEKKVFKFEVNVGEDDKMFGSITSIQIAQKLQEEGYEIDKKKIELDQALSKLGEHQVMVKLYKGVYALIKVLLEKKDKED